MVWAGNYAESLTFWIKDFLFIGLLGLLFVVFRQSDRLVKVFIRALSVGCFISVAIAIVQLFQWTTHHNIFKDDPLGLTANMGHKNLLSAALLLWLPFNLYSFKSDTKLWKYLALLNAISSIGFICLLEARSSWLGFIFMLTSLALLYGFERYRNAAIRIPKRIVVLSAIMLSVCLMFWHTTQSNKTPSHSLVLAPQMERASAASFTVKERLLLWKGSMRMALDNEIVGVGPGNWRFQFPKYGSDIWRARQGWVQFQRPHNDFVWVYTENGIWGVMSYVLMFLVILYLGINGLKQKTLNQKDKLLLKMLLLVVVGYICVANFSFPKERIIHSALLYASFALIAATRFKIGDRDKIKLNSVPVFIPVLMVAISILGSVIGFQKWKGEVISKRIWQAKELKDWKHVKAFSQEARAAFFYQIDPTSIPICFYEGLALLNLEEKDRALESFQKAYRLHPNNIHIINNLASLYQLLHKTEESIFYYQRALDISPKFEDGALNLAALYFNQNNVLKAYETLVRYQNNFIYDDSVFKQYLLTVLRTANQNLVEEMQDEILKKSLRNMKDEDFLKVFEKNSWNTISLYKELIKNRIEHLQFESSEISPEKAKEYKRLYLR
jgi:O-antigen ligase